MKINRYLLSLLLVPVLLFAAKSYAQNVSEDNIAHAPSREHAFVLQEVRQDGSTLEATGMSRSKNLRDIVDDLDVVLYPEDKLSVFPDLYLEMGGKITLSRAPKINLQDGKKKTLYRSWAGTVEEFLEEKKIELGTDDKISLELTSPLRDGSEIKINRVAKTTVVEKKDIDFQIVKKSDPNQEKGYKKIETKGAKGSKDYYYEVTRIDGEEVSRRLVKTEITKEPISEVQVIGTKVIVYGTGKATWYVRSSEMIAANNSLPRGTKVTVVNVNNGKRVNVTISGGGIQHSDNVIVDLSTAAFQALGASLGTGKLENIRLEKYYPDN